MCRGFFSFGEKFNYMPILSNFCKISNFSSACSTASECEDDDSHLQIISAFLPFCKAGEDGSKQNVLSNRCVQNNRLVNKMTQTAVL